MNAEHALDQIVITEQHLHDAYTVTPHWIQNVLSTQPRQPLAKFVMRTMMINATQIYRNSM